MDLFRLEIEIASFREVINFYKEQIKGPTKIYSVEERWKAYLLIQPYLGTDSCYWSPESVKDPGEISWYDDFYLDRHAVQKLDADFIKKIEEKIEKEDWVVDIDELKEEIMAYGYGSFENDW